MIDDDDEDDDNAHGWRLPHGSEWDTDIQNWGRC